MSAPYYKQHWIDIDDSRFAVYDTLLQYHPRMEPLIAPLDLHLGLSVLDVGSGPGYVTLELGRRVGPTGHVAGIDINETFISRAKARVREQGFAHISFRHAAFPPFPFAAGIFDRVFCKNVLEYVDSAELTIREISRVTKSGGKILLIDSDWDMLVLDVSDGELHDRVVHAVKTTATREPRIGRKLARLCRIAGLREISAKIFASPDLSGWTLPMLENNLYQYITVSGEVSQAEADTWLNDIKARVKNGDYFFCLPQFVVSAQKP